MQPIKYQWCCKYTRQIYYFETRKNFFNHYEFSTFISQFCLNQLNVKQNFSSPAMSKLTTNQNVHISHI